MALAKFRCKVFDSFLDLQNFVQTDTDLASVTSIVTDSSGKYVLFYLVA
jgi:hypothetical protein